MWCQNTCFTADDTTCDDGGPDSTYAFCAYATDCMDCGPRFMYPPSPPPPLPPSHPPSTPPTSPPSPPPSPPPPSPPPLPPLYPPPYPPVSFSASLRVSLDPTNASLDPTANIAFGQAIMLIWQERANVSSLSKVSISMHQTEEWQLDMSLPANDPRLHNASARATFELEVARVACVGLNGVCFAQSIPDASEGMATASSNASSNASSHVSSDASSSAPLGRRLGHLNRPPQSPRPSPPPPAAPPSPPEPPPSPPPSPPPPSPPPPFIPPPSFPPALPPAPPPPAVALYLNRSYDFLSSPNASVPLVDLLSRSPEPEAILGTTVLTLSVVAEVTAETVGGGPDEAFRNSNALRASIKELLPQLSFTVDPQVINPPRPPPLPPPPSLPPEPPEPPSAPQPQDPLTVQPEWPVSPPPSPSKSSYVLWLVPTVLTIGSLAILVFAVVMCREYRRAPSSKTRRARVSTVDVKPASPKRRFNRASTFRVQPVSTDVQAEDSQAVDDGAEASWRAPRRVDPPALVRVVPPPLEEPMEGGDVVSSSEPTDTELSRDPPSAVPDVDTSTICESSSDPGAGVLASLMQSGDEEPAPAAELLPGSSAPGAGVLASLMQSGDEEPAPAAELLPEASIAAASDVGSTCAAREAGSDTGAGVLQSLMQMDDEEPDHVADRPPMVPTRADPAGAVPASNFVSPLRAKSPPSASPAPAPSLLDEIDSTEEQSTAVDTSKWTLKMAVERGRRSGLVTVSMTERLRPVIQQAMDLPPPSTHAPTLSTQGMQRSTSDVRLDAIRRVSSVNLMRSASVAHAPMPSRRPPPPPPVPRPPSRSQTSTTRTTATRNTAQAEQCAPNCAQDGAVLE